MNVYIWGTGKTASAYLKTNEVKADDILGFIESKRSKDSFSGKKVYEPQEVAAKDDYDYIIVCVTEGYTTPTSHLALLAAFKLPVIRMSVS